MIHHSIYKEKEEGLTVGFINKFVQDPGILLKLLFTCFLLCSGAAFGSGSNAIAEGLTFSRIVKSVDAQ